jgi:hypothetical protein
VNSVSCVGTSLWEHTQLDTLERQDLRMQGHIHLQIGLDKSELSLYYIRNGYIYCRYLIHSEGVPL